MHIITGFFSPYRLEMKLGMVMASSFTLYRRSRRATSRKFR